ncbi:LysR family transcriptional regulator [Novosphingobium guangzhouense]|uniref:LysR family transcriptional regulator n=1 Tax=Novosphingobium guangzhouense TaxID=1850347 RepID=A0A2K2FWA2_9SPHN|nr:LysR family transcriptional regulator [Novosphingobium guangzhouense]PNU03055.1 LysR family transcriptional regulator [Novosphingobium guangzhouense]
MNLSRSDLGDLKVFMELARHGGFRKAALEMDVSASALSHALRGLETRLGVRLINRNARSVSLTQAGEELLVQLETGFGAIGAGVEALNRYRASPAGRLRINALSDAARLLLGPVIARYSAEHPDVDLEIVVQDAMVDIVGEGFDAGIRFGDRVPEDMITMPLGDPLLWVMVASPAYLEATGEPERPEDLARHRCIGMRTGTGAMYHWELGAGKTARTLNLSWSAVVDESALAIDIARNHGGIAYCLRERVTGLIETGQLREVLPQWSSPGEAFHIYYPSRRQQPEALRRFITMVRDEARTEGAQRPTSLSNE